MTSSVTGCSTWMRPFSSRKKNSPPVEHELGRAEAAVADRAGERDGRVAHPRRAARRRPRATPRAPSGGGAGSSTRARRARRPSPCAGGELDLDVARPLDVALAEDAVVAERRLRLAAAPPRARRRARAGSRTTRMPRPPPPAAALITSGKPISSGSPVGTTGTPASCRDPLRLELVAAEAERLGDGPTKVRPASSTAAAKPGSRPGSRSRGGSRRRRPRAPRGRARADRGSRDLDRLVRDARVQRAAVVGRGHGHGRDPELAAGAEDAHGDLAAVGDQELGDRHCRRLGPASSGERQAAGRFSRKARRPSWPSAPARRPAATSVVASSRGPSRTSRFAARAASGPAEASSPSTRSTAASGSVGDLVHEPDPERRLGVEALAGEEVARRAAAPIRGSTNGEMTAGMIPSFTSEKPKTASVAAMRDVGARDEPGAAAEHVAVRARDHRRGAAVDRLDHPVEAERVLDVLLVRQVDRRALPLDVGARAERRAFAGEHDGARVADVRERLGELADQLRVEGVAPLRLRERHAQHCSVALDPQARHRRGSLSSRAC